MYTQKEALFILNCSKMTLSRYVKSNKLKRIKNGRKSYYDKYEVAALVKQIEHNKSKYKRENTPGDEVLSEIGHKYLSEAIQELKTLNLYDNVDKNILTSYALAAQNYHKYLKAMKHYEKSLGLDPQITSKFPIVEKEEK